MERILHQYTNESTGMTAFVVVGAKGYHVSLRDDDSGEFLPTVTCFPELERAVAKAKEVLKGI